jgi:hypothetical protein
VTTRGIVWVGMRAAAGILSAVVTLHGVYSALAVDIRANSVLTALYCLFPSLSFPVFVFVKKPRLEVLLQAGLAIGYVTTYSMLNWRTCSELAYCGTMTLTVLETTRIRSVVAAFGVVVCNVAALTLSVRSPNRSIPEGK